MNRIEDREKILNSMVVNKGQISILKSEAEKIDKILMERWKIDFMKTSEGFEALLEGIENPEIRKLGISSYKEALRSLKAGGSEIAIYEAMCEPTLCGIFASKRRHLLIDSLALTLSIARKLDITGPILDVGCHVGIFPDILKEMLSNKIIGLEPISKAVETARIRVPESDQICFVKGEIPWISDRRFELITAIDSMPSSNGERGLYLRNLSSLLENGGIAIVVSQHWVEADIQILRRQLNSCGLGYGLADIIGGYGGMPTKFECEGCLVFVKGGKRNFPRGVRVLMESHWSAFQSYANAASTVMREKTQAFHRSDQTQ